MKSATSALLGLIALTVALPVGADGLRERVLREAALKNGLRPVAEMNPTVDIELAAAGALLFESDRLSVTENISCQTCHMDEHGSADGLPNAAGIGAEGRGVERLMDGGAIVPRNALALWGRGSADFTTFFWDGKVEKVSGVVRSQFKDQPPSTDPLKVAAHLPMVEVDEMFERQAALSLDVYSETVEAAAEVYELLAKRVQGDEALASPLSDAFGIPPEEIRISHIVDGLTAHIRHKFRVRDTRLHSFVFEDGTLSESEIAGGLLFYGKGRCALCHNGPHFSDLDFHAIPFPQIGFGKNGFGVDYGRFNVTLDPEDRYRFRTAPLLNVSETAPYSHAGSVRTLEDAIRFHFDPLSSAEVARMDEYERVEYYARLDAWAREGRRVPHLTGQEVEDLAAYLQTLQFEIAAN